ncbi:MAG TPA: hypothetical protein VJ625_06140, partial [Propionibacteriaceae bacterium]|nr:hypothetical protein [Propionibacteriaceae bacterium]
IWVERQAGVLSRAQLIGFGLCDSQVSRLVHQQVLTSPPRTLVEDTILDRCAAAPDNAAVIGFLTLSIPRLTNPRNAGFDRLSPQRLRA